MILDGCMIAITAIIVGHETRDTCVLLFDRVRLCSGSSSVPRRGKATWTPQNLSIEQKIPYHREKTSPIQLACKESTTFMYVSPKEEYFYCYCRRQF